MGGRKDKEKREKALEDQRAVREHAGFIIHTYSCGILYCRILCLVLQNVNPSNRFL